MAKKKVFHSHQEKPHQRQEELVQAPQKDSIAMENEASAKLESLKSLNQRLLKEAMERRQEVKSLMLSKGSLESELTGANSKMEMLRNELTQVRDEVVHLELERSVVSVFVALQLGHRAEQFEGKIKGLSAVIEEKERSIGLLNEKLSKTVAELESERDSSRRVIEERDGMKGKLDVKIEEANGLRTNLIELKEGKIVIEQQIEKIRDENNRVLEENQERDRKIEVMVSDKKLLEKSLVESNKLVEKMKEEIEEIVKEKHRIEEEKTLEMVKGGELESVVRGLNEKVTSLQTEEEKLRANLAKLEKKCAEGVVREKDMGMEIDELMKEKKLNEKICEGLIEEKNRVEKNMNEALKQLNNHSRKIDELVNEKIELVNEKDRLASEVVSLQNKVVKFESVILEFELSVRDKVEKIKNLESEMSGYKYEIEQMKGERDDLRKFLDEEKQIAMGLKEKIEEMEKRIEESENATEKVKAENLAILGEKKELEIQCDALKKSMASLEKSLVEVQNGLDAMRGKVESADANKSLVTKMLRDTVAFCSKHERDAVEGDLLGGKRISGEEMKVHNVELEKIKNAFVSKETKVENMKRQLEGLQISVAEAHKKKSFWTILSSVTTLLAAVSLAFVAHGR